MFQKLQWLPTDDIIGIKKLCMMFKIVNKECPVCFTSYRTYIKNTHSYNTRLSPNNALAVPKCRSNTGLRTLYARATRLWNRLDDKLKNRTNKSNFEKHLLEKSLNINASRKRFSITRTFQGTFFYFCYLDCTVSLNLFLRYLLHFRIICRLGPQCVQCKLLGLFLYSFTAVKRDAI